MGDLLIGLLGCIPRFQTTMLETGGIVNLVFKIQIKVLVLWNELFCVYNCACSVQCWEDLGCLALGCTRWGFIFFRWCVRGQCLNIWPACRARRLLFIPACFLKLPAPRCTALSALPQRCCGQGGRLGAGSPSGAAHGNASPAPPGPGHCHRLGSRWRRHGTSLRSLDGGFSWQHVTAKALLILGAEAWSFLRAEFLGLLWESFRMSKVNRNWLPLGVWNRWAQLT